MKYIKLFLTFIGAAVLLYFAGLFFLGNPGQGGALTSRSCEITQTTVSVGNQLTREMLATTSRRAWAIIQQPINATNTVSLSFNEGASAVSGSGYELTEATTTSDIPQITFGLATDFPYISSVQAITNNGSSTVLVTECEL